MRRAGVVRRRAPLEEHHARARCNVLAVEPEHAEGCAPLYGTPHPRGVRAVRAFQPVTFEFGRIREGRLAVPGERRRDLGHRDANGGRVAYALNLKRLDPRGFVSHSRMLGGVGWTGWGTGA